MHKITIVIVEKKVRFLLLKLDDFILWCRKFVICLMWQVRYMAVFNFELNIGAQLFVIFQILSQ